jgi:hypothetical protein
MPVTCVATESAHVPFVDHRLASSPEPVVVNASTTTWSASTEPTPSDRAIATWWATVSASVAGTTVPTEGTTRRRAGVSASSGEVGGVRTGPVARASAESGVDRAGKP